MMSHVTKQVIDAYGIQLLRLVQNILVIPIRLKLEAVNTSILGT